MMKRYTLPRLASLLGMSMLALSFAACSSDDPVDDKKVPIPEEIVTPNEPPTPFKAIQLDRTLHDCNTRLNDASLRLFKTALSEGKENVTISPLSINYVLASLLNGADGGTRDEILSYLNIDNVENANALFRIYAEQLSTLDNQVSLNLANAIWLDNQYSLAPAYKKFLDEGWPVEFYSEPLHTELCKTNINSWVAKNTRNLIKEFLKQPLEGVMGIFNTVYFNGKWRVPFDPSKTTRKIFNGIEGGVNVDMMEGDRSEFMYARGDNWQGVALPYGNGNYQMRLILPDNGVALTDLELSEANMRWSAGYDVKTLLPKFETNYRNEDMIGLLMKMGITKLFDPSACSLPNLIEGKTDDLVVGKIIHETVVKVDESGAEMAAATGTDIVTSVAPSETKNVDLVFDRPFIFEVRETSTNTLLFIGAVRSL